MAAIFHTIGDLKLRRNITVAELEGVPEAYRVAYMEHDDGDLELSVRTADYVATALGEIASLTAQAEKIQVEGPAKLAAAKQRTRDDAVALTLQSALAKAGVKADLLEGAIALVKKKNEFEVEASDDGGYAVLARTKFGLATVDAVVQQFMDDEGAAYRGKPIAPSAGSHFSQLQSGLKRPH
jgi:Asp-tRNA(Asn)/Glu-tRNA(Gln) amidotransferase C subunit